MQNQNLPTYRCIILLLLLLLLLFVSAELFADDLTGVKLHWKPPVEFTNGEKIKNPESELSEYRLYFGPSREKVRKEYVVINSKQHSFALQQLDLSKIKSPVIYLAMTAITKAGLESDLSEIIFFLP